MPKKKSNKKNKKKQALRSGSFSLKRFLLKITLLGIIYGSIAAFVLLAYYAHDLPDVSKIDENIRQPSITLYDKENKPIATIGDLYGDYIEYKSFPKTLIDAVTSTEDRKFFKHSGIDMWGMARAGFVNFFAGRVVQGGSTITQQLAKNVYLSHERTFKRKIQELALALYLENKFTKQQILTMYLNRIYMGNGNYGMDAAARSYFGKTVSEINLQESAILAGLLKAPSHYSPVNNPQLALKRAGQVLVNMVNNGAIKSSQLPKSGRLGYNFAQAKARVQNKAPYFTDWIREQLPDYIGQYSSGNIEIYTTIDAQLQHIADEVVARSLAANGQKHDVGQGAMVVMSPSGAVLAMTGGKSYTASQFNRATQALRQPGSAFKLFVYLAALESGYTPDTIVSDTPISIGSWSPENHDNAFLGDITIREALAKSVNTVAVKVAKDVGMGRVRNMAYKLGVTSEVKNDLSSALGTSEVTLLELTGAYAHLASNGNAVWTHGINEIKINGESVYKRQKSGEERVLSQRATMQMNSMLMSVVQSGTGHNAKLPFDVAGKTGTTQNLRDAWFIGFTSDYVAGVWMGNDDASSMDRIAGGSLPALIWKDFMRAAELGKSPANIPVASGGLFGSNNDTKEGVWGEIVNVFGVKQEGGDKEVPKRNKEELLADPELANQPEEPAHSETQQQEDAPTKATSSDVKQPDNPVNQDTSTDHTKIELFAEPENQNQ
jgi:penicillin-binding protein 1A